MTSAAVERAAPAMLDLRPLAGRVIAVTRPAERAARLVDALVTLGATVLAAPAVAVEVIEDHATLDGHLNAERAHDWLVLTSTAAVDVVATRLAALRRGLARATCVAVVGKATAEAARVRLGRVDFVPTQHFGDALAQELPRTLGARVLFPCADRARDVLPTILRARGARVDRVPSYRTIDAGVDALRDLVERTARREVDVLLLASPSAAGAFARAHAAVVPNADVHDSGVRVACIGPTTADAATRHGFVVAAVADEPTDDALVRAARAALAPHDP